MYTLGNPNPELTKWYQQLENARFLVVYDDGGPSIAVKSDKVYAIHRGSVEVVE